MASRAMFFALSVLILACSLVSGADIRSVFKRIDVKSAEEPKLRQAHVQAADGLSTMHQKTAHILPGKDGEEKVAPAAPPEEKKEGEGEKPEGDHAGYLFAIGMFGTIVTLAVVFSMASMDNSTVKCYTWASLDNVTAVFVAVLFFQAFDTLLDEWALPDTHKVAVQTLHAVFLLVLAFVLSWQLRKDETNLAIFCAAGAHYVSFASMHAAILFLNHHWSSFVYEVFIGLTIIMLFMGVLYAATEAGRRAAKFEDEGWQDKFDDLQNDFGAMAVAVCWSLLVRACIAGEYHHISADEESEEEHTSAERMTMLIYAIAMIPIAGFSVRMMSSASARMEAEGTLTYGKKRAIMFISAVLCMSVAWGFLLWGEWEFDKVKGEGGPEIQGKVYFALTATCLSCLAIIGLGLSGSSSRGRHERKVLLVALSLLVGWSWEESFDAAVEAVTEETGHAGRTKIAIALALGCIILPVYAKFLKPIAMKYEEELEAADEAASKERLS